MPVSSKYRRSKHQTIPVANRMLALGSPKVPISRSLRLNDQFVSVQSTHCSLASLPCIWQSACAFFFTKYDSDFVYKANHHLSTQFLSRSFQMCCPIIELVEPSNFSDPASRMAPNKLIDDVALPSLRVKAAAKDVWFFGLKMGHGWKNDNSPVDFKGKLWKMSPTNFRPSHWRLPEEPHQIQRGQGEFVDLFGRVWLFQLLPRRDLVESNWPNLISYI